MLSLFIGSLLLPFLVGPNAVSALPSSSPLILQNQDQAHVLDMGREQIPFEPTMADGLSHEKVNVSLYVMSRCPDARVCESIFHQVFKEEGILDKIDVDIGYIGWKNTSSPLGVSCKHGPIECLGNAHQLCLLRHLSLTQYADIVDCQNYPDSFPAEIGTLKSVRKCADIVGIDWERSGIGRCIEGDRNEEEEVTADSTEEFDGDEVALGEEAKSLLRKNIKRTLKTGVTTSCTIDIASTIVRGGSRSCVVDGGVWKGCDDGHTASDFVRVIREEYDSLNGHSRKLGEIR